MYSSSLYSITYRNIIFIWDIAKVDAPFPFSSDDSFSSIFFPQGKQEPPFLKLKPPNQQQYAGMPLGDRRKIYSLN